MKKSLLSLFAFAAIGAMSAEAASFTIDEKVYDYDLLIKKEIGPGVTYHRIRIPDYPLNINYMTVDLTNPYNRVETQQGQEKIGSLEKLADAYTRMQKEGKKPLGAQNANFWVVTGHGLPNNRYAMGVTFNANVKNGQIITETNNRWDQFVGGPTRSGVVGIDKDKNLWIQSMEYRGTLASPKWGGQKAEIIQCNRFGRRDEMVLFNSYYPNNKPFQIIEWSDEINDYRLVEGENTEIYLDLEEGQEWCIGKDFTAVVKDVKTNTSGGILGDYDLCLSANGAGYFPLVNQLAAGDKVTLNFGWRSYATDEIPEIENMVGGNAIILQNGEVTGRNYDEDYNSQVYSRSAYGASEDGKMLYMLTIDYSIDAKYGRSVGCSTGVEAQIMKQLGAWNVCAVDAGGSAQLMVQGDVVNKTTEGTPRAVANGWMVYSVAPDTDKSSVISRIEFFEPELNVPVYSSYRPIILGYNEYGELIDEDVEGVTISGGAPLGEASGDTFNTFGTPGECAITASYEGLEVSKSLQVVDAEVSVRVAEIMNDGRNYPVEVVSKIGFNDFQCDPSRLEWTVDDPEIVSIENGVLKGLKNGATTITGRISDFQTSANVTVELPEGTVMPIIREFPTDWKLLQNGGTNLTVSKEGEGLKLAYTGNGSGRGAYIQASSDLRVWSMPKAFRISVNPGDAEVKKVAIGVTNGMGDFNSSFVFTDQVLPKNELTTIDLNVSEWCSPDDVANYPMTVKTLRFDMGTSAKNTDFEVLVPKFEAVYGADGSVAPLPAASCGVKMYPNPVSDGILNLVVSGDVTAATVSVYNNAGALLLGKTVEFTSGRASLGVASLGKGIYYVKVVTGDNVSVGKIIVR